MPVPSHKFLRTATINSIFTFRIEPISEILAHADVASVDLRGKLGGSVSFNDLLYA